MAEQQIARMTADEFLEWDPGDDEKYELVDGVPVMMTGARRGHDDIVVNGLAVLRAKLRGGPCRPYTDDLAVKVTNGNIRRPDILVDCKTSDTTDLVAREPVLVIEVLSPSNQRDMVHKLYEYKALKAIRYILLLEQERVAAKFSERIGETTWNDTTLIGADTRIDLPALGIELALGDFYDDGL